MKHIQQGRCPYCIAGTLKYTGQSWTTTGEKAVRLTMVCEACGKVSVWKLEDIMSD